MGSSNVNEGINNIVCSKQPKSRSYASSPSFNYRVGAAISQKNVGYTYVCDVLTKAGLSPSKRASELGAQMNAKQKRDAARKSTIEFKKRRLFLKDARSSKQASSEL